MFYREKLSGIELFIYLQPGASKSEITGLHGERLKIKVKARPIEGEANRNLIDFLSETFKISKSKIEILSGEKSREKNVYLEITKDKLLEKVKI